MSDRLPTGQEGEQHPGDQVAEATRGVASVQSRPATALGARSLWMGEQTVRGAGKYLQGLVPDQLGDRSIWSSSPWMIRVDTSTRCRSSVGRSRRKP